jgi:hypothetical protein
MICEALKYGMHHLLVGYQDLSVVFKSCVEHLARFAVYSIINAVLPISKFVASIAASTIVSTLFFNVCVVGLSWYAF